MREIVEKVNYDAITHEILIMERLCANRMSVSPKKKKSKLVVPNH